MVLLGSGWIELSTIWFELLDIGKDYAIYFFWYISHRKQYTENSFLPNVFYFVGGKFVENLSYFKHFANLIDLNTPKPLWYLKSQRNQNRVKKTIVY